MVARPGGTSDQFNTFRLNGVNSTPTSQTFRIDSSLDPEFSQMVAARNFFFWFAEETLGRDDFRLVGAALLGLGGLGFARRRTQAQ